MVRRSRPVLRRFCLASFRRVPGDPTLIRRARLVGPDALQALNDRAVARARSLEVTRGRKSRPDTTAAADIRYPTTAP